MASPGPPWPWAWPRKERFWPSEWRCSASLRGSATGLGGVTPSPIARGAAAATAARVGVPVFGRRDGLVEVDIATLLQPLC